MKEPGKNKKKSKKNESAAVAATNGPSEVDKGISKAYGLELQGMSYSVEGFSFQSNVVGDKLFVIENAAGLPRIEYSFDLDQGVSFFFDADSEHLSINYGDFPIDKQSSLVPPPVFKQIALRSSISAIHFQESSRSLNFTGVGSVDLITTDPVDFSFMTAPFTKIYSWVPTIIPIPAHTGSANVLLVMIDHVHVQYIAGDQPFWNVTVYFRDFSSGGA